MGEKTKISWCDATFNPWIGCTKVHAGCTHCYAEADMDTRRGRVEWGPNGTRSKTSDDYWKKPIKWNRDAACLRTFDCTNGEHADCCPQKNRPRVFCASLADVFEDWQGPIVYGVKEPIYLSKDNRASNGSNRMTMDDLRAELFKLIDATPNLDWMILTKRPENIRRMWNHPASDVSEVDCFRRNVWLLTSVSTQATYNAMAPELWKCRDLSPVLGFSCEPLLEGIDLFDPIEPTERDWDEFNDRTIGMEGWEEPEDFIPECEEECDHINYGNRLVHSSEHKEWESERLRYAQRIAFGRLTNLVITGGESGKDARPCDVSWIRSIGQQSQSAHVSWWNKQLGSYAVTNGITHPGGHWPSGTKKHDINFQTGLGFYVQLKHHSGADPSEWPEDLRVQQMPTREVRA